MEILVKQNNLREYFTRSLLSQKKDRRHLEILSQGELLEEVGRALSRDYVIVGNALGDGMVVACVLVPFRSRIKIFKRWVWVCVVMQSEHVF